MKYKDLMYESLTELLEENETLMYPIYGILHYRNEPRYAFFGFTEKHLLIAIISGKTVTHTFSLPLDIKSIKIHRSKISNQYKIAISFNHDSPFEISASRNVLFIDTQKENLPLFIKYLEEKSPEQNTVSLKDINGKKIRWQYFNIWIYVLISFFLMILIMFSVYDLKAGEFSWANITEVLWIEMTWLLPFCVLSVLNRFLFGKIVSVANEKGIYLDNDFIPWEKIKKIEYYPELPQKHKATYTYASLIVDGPNHNYGIHITHFPFYGLKTIKKFAPQIESEIPRGRMIFIGFMFFMPSLLGLIMILF